MQDKQKCYISGKITGIEKEAFDKFEEAEIMLSLMGYEVVNPMKLPHDHDKQWHSFMREDIRAMTDCNVIYMLKGWHDSKGSIIEHEIAVSIGLEVKYQ